MVTATATKDSLAAKDPAARAGAKATADAESTKRAWYAAFKAGDSRYDGQLFVGVSSTGIYCRPVCRAKMPKYENCTFYTSAAEAELAGYRPCLCCRPEIAPGMSSVDARSSLARRAATMLREQCSSGEGLERLSERLGYTDRHLRRVFESEYGMTPMRYLETCRLLLAKSLLTDTRLPIAQVATASGFGSVRQLNRLFKERYQLTPTDLRKRRGASAGNQDVAFYLGYRTPFDFAQLLGFFRARQLEGVERVDDASYSRTVRLRDVDGAEVTGWFRVEDDPAHSRLKVCISESLLPVFSQVAARIRRLFDLDCNPQVVYDGIASLDETVPGAAVAGTRVPGAFDPFEIAVRAILGQQVSVPAANKMAARIARAYGAPIETGIDGLDRAFPTAEEFLAMDPIEESLGPLGVIRSRAFAIREVAQLLVQGELDLSATADVSQQMERLLAVKGIGPWSANYIAMRALGYADAFMEKDAGIKHALPSLSPDERFALAEQWRPWRSYATICLWNSLE